MLKVETDIPDVWIVEPTLFGDDRGFFMETWRHEWFIAATDKPFVQDNHSKSVQGTLRGLHYQTKYTQGKFIRVLDGQIYDVVVDLRKKSRTFGQWIGIELSSANNRSLWVPEGFAHGFYVLSESAEITYKCTDYYAPEYEHTLMWDDPDLAIDWPLVEKQVLLSKKDSSGSYFSACPKFE